MADVSRRPCIAVEGVSYCEGCGWPVEEHAYAGVVPGMKGGPHGPSVKKANTYEALRRQGASKQKSARIANAQANGTISHKRGGKRKGGGKKGGRK